MIAIPERCPTCRRKLFVFKTRRHPRGVRERIIRCKNPDCGFRVDTEERVVARKRPHMA